MGQAALPGCPVYRSAGAGCLSPLHATPEYLSQLLSARSDTRTVIIDEIQKAPQLLDVVHQLIETYSDVQFVLTGSSAESSNAAVSTFWPAALFPKRCIRSWRGAGRPVFTRNRAGPRHGAAGPGYATTR